MSLVTGGQTGVDRAALGGACSLVGLLQGSGNGRSPEGESDSRL